MRLIDADALRSDWLENGQNEYVYDTNAVLDSIDIAPTIEAEPAQWISVSERLPDESIDWVLVAMQFAESKRGYAVPNIAELRNGKWRLMDNEYSLEQLGLVVSHWMPLPEPPMARQQATSQENNKISSHSERDIVLGCIALIDEVLNGEFAIFEQLEADGFDFDEYKKRSECELGYSLTYFEIVQRLLLYHTTHSGGTSTRAKCRELGFDPNQCVSFHRDRGDEEDEG